jgi:iron complex transport system substrate-binding protein
MTRRGLLLAIAIGAVAACSRGEAAARRAVDANRIVSLAPSMTEALFAIGAGDRVVGRSRFCDYPPEAMRVRIVGGVEPDLEAILDLHPDLVVGIAGLTSDRLMGKLGTRGIQSWLPEAASLGAIDELLIQLGERVGHEQDARRLVVSLQAREKVIELAVSGQPRPRVLMVIAIAPVVVAGPRTFADELIHAAGGQNAVVDGTAWPIIGFERIVGLDPDVVLDATHVGGDMASRITADSPGWRGLRAVREGRVVAVRDERVIRPGPRVAEGLAVLARALHPESAVP